MKKLFLFIFLSLFVIPFGANAETSDLYLHKLETNTSGYKTGDTVEGQFVVTNTGDEEESDLFYRIFLSDPLDGRVEFANASQIQGPIKLAPGEEKHLSYKYKIYGETFGNVVLGASLEKSNGSPISWFTVPIFVEKVEVSRNDGLKTNYIIVSILSLIVVIILAFIVKRFYPNKHMVALALLFGGTMGILTLPTQTTLAGTVYENPANGCINLNGIASPQPGGVSSYSPGQTFNLGFTVEYICGDLENDNLELFTPSSGQNWYQDNTPTSPTGVSWWRSNGVRYSVPVTGGSSVTSVTVPYTTGSFTAPTTPGNHTIYFLASQSGSTNGEMLGSQTICVTGGGLCPGEGNTSGDLCPNILGDQSTVPNGHFIDNSGNCVISRLSCSPDPLTGTVGQNIDFTSGIRYSGNESNISFCWDGNCASDGVNSSGIVESMRTMNFGSIGTHSFPISATISSGGPNICSVGDTPCDQEFTVFDPTNTIALDSGYSFRWTCFGCGIKGRSETYDAPAKGGQAEALEACKAAGYQELVSFGTTDHDGWYRQGATTPLRADHPVAASTYDPSTNSWTSNMVNRGEPLLDHNKVVCAKPVGCTDCLCKAGGPCTQTTTVQSPSLVIDHLTNTNLLPFTGGHNVLRDAYPNVAGDDPSATEICNLLGYNQMLGYSTGSYSSQSDNTIVKFVNGSWNVSGAIAFGNRYISSNSLVCQKPIVHNINPETPQTYNSSCTIDIINSPLTCSVDNPNPKAGENVTFTVNSNSPLVDVASDEICWNGTVCGIGWNTFTTNFGSVGPNSVTVETTSGGGTGTTFGPLSCPITVSPSGFTTNCSGTVNTNNSATYKATSSGSGGPVTYSWKDNGIEVGTGDTYTTPPLPSGNHTITVDAADGNGTATSNCGVSIGGNSLSVSCIPPSGSINQNLTFDATPHNAAGSVSYTWTDLSRNPAQNGTGKNFSTSFISPGNYNYQVEATSGSETATDSCTVVVGALAPDPSIDEFKLQPSVVSTGGTCGLFFEASNILRCDPIGGIDITSQIINGSVNIDAIINGLRAGVLPGTYNASCQGINGKLVIDGPRRCIGNPEIIEQ